jgi:hypothetical protein
MRRWMVCLGLAIAPLPRVSAVPPDASHPSEPATHTVSAPQATYNAWYGTAGDRRRPEWTGRTSALPEAGRPVSAQVEAVQQTEPIDRAASETAAGVVAPSIDAWSGPLGAPGYWVEADYLLWWMQGSRLPPLVTTSPAGTPLENAGVLGTPGTAVLFGGERVNASARSGGRVFLGTWLDAAQTFGVEGHFLYLESKSANFSAGSDSTILGRPFSDAVSGTQAAQQVAFPGTLQGSVLVANATNGLLGAGVLARQLVRGGGDWRLHYLAGYRYLRFADRLRVDENLTALPGNGVVPPGTRLIVTDEFGTRNEFHGLDTGLAANFAVGALQLRLLGKIALGSTYQVVDIGGATTTTLPGGTPVTEPGGLLALSTNMGHHTRQRFAIIPEIGARVGGNLTPNLRCWVGYTWLYWSSVARAGDQVDLRVNPGLIPPPTNPLIGPALPGFLFQSHHFWAQGIDFGLEFLF